MIFFIVFLRALAACLITNAHYTGIYPTDLIANGGLIGDILFFAVSGYCLCNIKMKFFPWYGKRLWRVYLPSILITSIYLLLGAYSFEHYSPFWWYVYPTYYHFLASIIVLYVPFYFIMRWERLKTHIPAVMSAIAAVWLLIYVFAYDKSYYHIDTVREPMIRFLFMESMLLGAWFRMQGDKVRNKFHRADPVIAVAMFFLYFASKLLFSRRQALAPFQMVNQLIIFALLFFVFRMCAGLDSKLEKLPRWLKSVIQFIADRTLEIYVVQYVLIDVLRPVGHFPVNWIVLTASILAAACILHWVCGKIYALTDNLVGKRKIH